jgi:UDP-N-acetylmuramoyl-L-alanyl-D-glutamate--2,6-diaminopimelate ligase
MKKLSTLLSVLNNYQTYGLKDVEISKITDDSRKVKKKSLFVAISGIKIDAHKFIPNVISSGAIAIVGEKDPHKSWIDKTTYIKVLNSRRALGLLASAWHNFPSEKLKVIGVTGTDGKTTTTNIIYWILNKSKKKSGLVSTVSAKIGGVERDTGLHVTNPEPIQLQKFLSEMVKEDCEYAVLEVTSHGLDQERIAGIDFDIAVLTNITHEHIDYHKTYGKYLRSKSKLFKKAKVVVLNKDDSSYEKIKRGLSSKTKQLSYESKTLKGAIKKVIDKRFAEPYNRLNATAAVVVARELGIKDANITKAIKTFPGIPGRMDRINDKGIDIFVDFAHTPNALKNVLQTLKNSKKKENKLIVVFGCAGERDIEKRIKMGNISTKIANISIFTAEDPRYENVDNIIQQMAKGAKKGGAKEFLQEKHKIQKFEKGHYFVRIPERGEGISFAIQKLAEKGDVVVICGKGHEKSMAYNDIEHPWSDHEAVKMALVGKVKKIKRKK